MIELFLCFIFSKKPIVLIPPLYGTNLYGTYSDFKSAWYCPTTANNSYLWANLFRFIPPFSRCLYTALTPEFDMNGKYINYKNHTIHVSDPESVNDVLYSASIPGTPLKFFGVYNKLVNRLLKKGYHDKQDLYAAPYDWRMAPHYLGRYNARLQQTIEKAYKKNGQKKVTLIGFSLGGQVIERFFRKSLTMWKTQYIDKVILIAPEIGGSLVPVLDMYHNRSSAIPKQSNQWIGEMVRSWPVTYSTLPRYHLFFNEVLIELPFGKLIHGGEIPNFIARHLLPRGQHVRVLNKTITKHLFKPIKDPDVPVFVIYNSGIDTIRNLSFVNITHMNPRIGYSGGDGRVLSDGPEFICNYWRDVRCVDVKNDGKEFLHSNLMQNDYVLDQIMGSLKGTFGIKGRVKEIAPMIKMKPFGGYNIREDIREFERNAVINDDL